MDFSSSTVVVDSSRSPYAKLHPVAIENVHLEDAFWTPRQHVLQMVTLPSQYQMLEETGCIQNFLVASGKRRGRIRGPVFIDSDVYKWIEAVAFSIADKPNQGLRDLAQKVISQIIVRKTNMEKIYASRKMSVA